MIDTREGLEVFRPYPQQLSWKVPAFCCNDWIALRLVDLCREIGFESPYHIAYGAPKSRWSGGRPSVVATELPEELVEAYFDAYEERGLAVALTFSRLVVDEADYKDAYANRLLDAAARHRAEIILFDDGLADYIRGRYPQLRLICSLNRPMSDYKDNFHGLDETAYYRRLLERYDEVVIRCEYAMDDANLLALAGVADRCEIICNQACVPNCRNVFRHVSSMENWGRDAAPQPCYSFKEAGDLSCRLCGNLHFSAGRIAQFAEMGFTKMKLAGRNAPIPKFLNMVSDYIFEPTGIAPFLREELSRQHQALLQAQGGRFAPFQLPEPMVFVNGGLKGSMGR